MIRRAHLALAAALLLALPAGAQTADEGASAIPDVPSGEGEIAGRVVHPGGGDVADLPVLLYALPAGGAPGLRRTRTDAEGGFVFEGVSTDPDVAWMVGTRYREVPFASRVAFREGTTADVRVAVSEPSTDASSVRVGEAELRLDWLGARLGVVQSQQLENTGGSVVYVPEAERAGRAPLLELALPEDAEDARVGFGLEGMVREGRRFTFWGPLYPGPHEVRVSYLLPAAGTEAELRLALPDGASALRVLVPEGPLRVRGAGLADAGSAEGEGRPLRALERGRVPAGGALSLVVSFPEVRRGVDALSLAEVRMWLELDDTALMVSEEHHVQVEGGTPVAGSMDDPLLRIALPEGAELRGLSDDADRLGLVRGPEGDLVLLGPVPPGESSVVLRYRMRAPAGDALLALRRHFAEDVPLLRVLVADTGVRLESNRLHRRRPIRSGTRTYLQLEGFWIDAGEETHLEVGRLARGGDLSRRAAAGVVLLAALAATAFLLAPVRAARAQGRDEADGGSPSAREREAVYASLRDLEHDFETGKLSEADYRVMRDELRARAAALLQLEEREAEAAEAAAPAAEPACPACGGKLDPEWSFCAHCGAAVPAESAR